MTVKVLIVDDQALVRAGFRMILESEPEIEIVGEAGDGAEAIELAVGEEVDLAVLDITMPRLTGLQAARELAQRRPETKVLMLSMHDNEEYLFEALRAGAAGYVLKSAVDRDLVEACRATLRGETFLYPGAVTALVRAHLERGDDDAEFDPLTPRESEVVKLVAEGMTTREIAEALFISPKTVERHRANVLEKLGMRDRVDLTRYAIRRGLVEP